MGQAIPAVEQRVLIVDDDETILEIAAVFVCELFVAPLSHFLRYLLHIRALFSDMTMPGMDGEQLAECALTLRPGLHVILTSGARRPSSKVAFVAKPYHAVDLVRVLPRRPLGRPRIF
jgi:DNA-binding NtrC family response regulator